MRVSVVIPTRNEAQALRHVLADLPASLVSEVIVVDSDSTDGTPEIAARMGARVIREPRRGYGRACLTGLADASSPDVVVFLDGDYSDRPAELPRLLAPDRRRACRHHARFAPRGAAHSRRAALACSLRQPPGRRLDHASVWAADHATLALSVPRARTSSASWRSKRQPTGGRSR